MNNQIKTHYRACNVCEATCGLEIKYQGTKILSIKGDKKDPLSKGHICPKGVALQDVYYDKDRLKYPVKKTATGWQQIGWKQAFDEVTGKIKSIQKQHGKDAVAFYSGNPTVHNMGAMMFMPMFSRTLRTKNRYSATSVDQLPDQLAAYLLFGHQLLVPVPDLDRTDCVLIIGANPVVSNGSMMTAPKVAQRLKDIQARGGKVINVDPRFTETSKLADQHLYINPGSDVYLLLAMLHVIFSKSYDDLGHVKDFTHELDDVKVLVSEYPPQKVAEITGIKAIDIENLVETFCQAKTACCYTRFGASTQKFGGMTQWLGNILNIVTSNFDKAGGVMFTKPAVDILAPAKNKNKQVFAKNHSRLRGLPSFAGELPVSAMAEEILTDGEGQIKMLITNSGNPVLSTPNGGKMDKALASLDYMVSVDFYINESSRHANIILPPTSSLERPHYNLAFHTLAIQNTSKYSETLFKPDANQRSDRQIYVELWSRMQKGGLGNKFKTWMTKRVINKKGEAGIIDEGLRKGPYADLNLQKVVDSKHGIDLGALEACMPERLFTADQQIYLVPDVIKKDMQRVSENLKSHTNNSAFPLQLIGRRDPRTNNSWMHNSYRLVKGKNRCVALVNTQDAKAHALEEGDEISVSSNKGKIALPVKVTDDIKQGIVSIPHGWGHVFDDMQLSIAKQHAGVNINNLMDTTQIDALSGNAVLSGVAVKIAKI
jgi:anaerobic selenocysteine-containing dehydrogenase